MFSPVARELCDYDDGFERCVCSSGTTMAGTVPINHNGCDMCSEYLEQAVDVFMLQWGFLYFGEMSEKNCSCYFEQGIDGIDSSYTDQLAI